MFNIGTSEFAIIAVLTLLVLGPKHLPEIARGIGKYLRIFRRHTEEIRSVVEREFYKLDAPTTKKFSPAEDSTPQEDSTLKDTTSSDDGAAPQDDGAAPK